MDGWINLSLDIVLVGLITAGLVQATRLIRHLAGLRQGRADMERFVREFNATVLRAEAGIKNLKQAARNSGDDLEKMVDKAVLMRDELHLIVESADKLANRLSQGTSATANPPEAQPAPKSAPPVTVTPFTAKKPPEGLSASQASRAEQELMQALEKLG